MKQVLQSLKTGTTTMLEGPCPVAGRGWVVVRSRASLISAGTERMLLEFGKAGWIEKARQQPDKVRQVLAKMRTDGVVATLEAVEAKLDQPIPLGYSNAGVVLEGDGFAAGTRVVSNGPHAEVVRAAKNLCAVIPDGVTDEAAAFTVVAAIALEGVRLAGPTLGETFVVTGLGLIGLITVQLLKACGCRVIGVDPDESKLRLAERFGAETVAVGRGADPVAFALQGTGGRGVDGVLLTLATQSDEPVHQAAQMCRKRGRIVLVGVTGLKLSRDDFYKKELSFQVSCSYGPGRYDPVYEGGVDYPAGYVRWTAQRNFEAVLQMMAEGRLRTEELVTHRFPISEAGAAYELLGGTEPYLGIVLEYGDGDVGGRTVRLGGGASGGGAGGPLPNGRGSVTRGSERRGSEAKGLEANGLEANGSDAGGSDASGSDANGLAVNGRDANGSDANGLDANGSGANGSERRGVGQAVRVGVIGAGGYASKVLLPALQKAGVALVSIGSSGGVSAAVAGRKFGFVEATTDVAALIASPSNNAVVVATRHDSHARYVTQALEADKAVFVEKPLGLTLAELDEVERAWRVKPRQLMVGFNRRFAPHVVKMKQLLAAVTGPRCVVITVNAGEIPGEHWTQSESEGGGRLIGEGCHFLDLARFLAGAAIVEAKWRRASTDTANLEIGFADGSIGSVHYFANGSKAFPKERVEVFGGGKVLQLDNFRVLRGCGFAGFSTMRLWRQDKGNAACAAAWVDAVRRGADSPIGFDELMEVSRWVVRAAE